MTELTVSLGERGAFVQALGLVLDEISGRRVTGHIDFGPDHHTPWGIVHGGVYATDIENVASIGATMAVRDKGQVGVGLVNTTNILRPLTEGRVHIEAVPLSQGRTQQLWRVDITDDDGRLVAHGELRLQNVEGARYA
jgi:uncharacterized protein (TIGR00369 family)